MKALEESLRFSVEEMCEKMSMLLPGCSLNYPGGSLCRMLEISGEDSAVLWEALQLFCADFSNRFGSVEAAPHEGGYCFTLSREAVRHVTEQPIGGDFLKAVCRLSQSCHASEEDWRAAFERYGDCKMISASDPEYDLLLYYPSGRPVRFVYCLKRDGEHLSVHRLDREDFEELYSTRRL